MSNIIKPDLILNNKSYKIIDLFCGIAGVRKGFERTHNYINILML
ncbi:hypothetical protein MNB_SV-13-1561 [hydrothermal vent metagenome]|uniref:DNA (cytosine-5-)-methyltransferase n=1 Tax=hydrothermal vent metagenome TaxID=652676 RepID=A0A1W1CQ15_9ZZZZ